MRKITTTKTRAALKASTAAKPVAQAPATSKPAAKPVSKPAPSKADTASAQRRELLGVERERVAAFYNGPSLTVHNSRNPKLSDCVERIRKPVQRANTPSTRDESLLLSIRAHADKSGAFDPSTFGCDIGVLSRLASLGFLAVNSSGMPMLTKTGIERAGNVASRAAKLA